MLPSAAKPAPATLRPPVAEPPPNSARGCARNGAPPWTPPGFAVARYLRVATTNADADVQGGRKPECARRASDRAISANQVNEVEEEPVWYLDADGHGWGNETQDYVACIQPEGYVEERTADNDDDANAATWHADDDGGGDGGEDTVPGCGRPEGTAEAGGDCDDTSPDVNPGAEEEDKSDGIDQDCDGNVERSWIAGRTLFSGCSSAASGTPVALARMLVAALPLGRGSRVGT